MKKAGIVLTIMMGMILMAFLGANVYTKPFSPKDEVVYQKDGKTIEINYCQPYKRGRIIFGDLVPYGQIWRTGANEATSISFNQDVEVKGKKLPKGNYTLYTIPGETFWTIVINKQTNQWGTEYNHSLDALRVEIEAEKMKKIVEMFTIDIQATDLGANINLEWDQVKVVIPVEFI